MLIFCNNIIILATFPFTKFQNFTIAFSIRRRILWITPTTLFANPPIPSNEAENPIKTGIALPKAFSIDLANRTYISAGSGLF